MASPIPGTGLMIVYGPFRQWLSCDQADATTVLSGWLAENPDAGRWGDLTAVCGVVLRSGLRGLEVTEEKVR